MLYKNLPENELKSVMRWRALLDYVAALKFLMTFDVANFKAVCRARKKVFRMRSDFESDKSATLKNTLLMAQTLQDV